MYIYINIENRKKTTLSSRQACFVIAHSSGDFICMYTLKNDDGTSYRLFRVFIVYLGQTSRSCIPQACCGVAVKVLTSFMTNLSVFQCNFFQLSLV